MTVSFGEIKDVCDTDMNKCLCKFLLYTPAILMSLSYLPNMWQILKSNHISTESLGR